MKTWAELGINVHGIEAQGKTLCPWCSANRRNKTERCLSVNVVEGVYQCHHCGVTGALKERDMELPAKSVWRLPAMVAESEIPQSTLDWFVTRGITADVVRANRIQRREHFMPQTGTSVPCIVFPYFRADVLVNSKYRDANKNFCMEAKAERILYGYNDIQDDLTIICEGEIDKLSMEVAGYRNCVSVPNGAPPPNAKNYTVNFSYLDDDRIGLVNTWVIAVDNDPAGTRLEQELCRRFGAEKCRRVKWPEGCKDANDVLVKHGPEKLRECIEAAEHFPLAGVISVRDVMKELRLLYNEGVKRGLSTGWRSLDEFYTVRPGEVTVVTGVPNSGKSNWVDGLAVNLAKHEGWKIGVFSPENQPLHNHMSRLMEHYARVPFRDGPTRRMSEADMEKNAEWLEQHFKFMLPPDESEWTVDYIIQTAEALVHRYGINAVVIDPWNELEHHRGEGQTETEYVSACLKRFRQFARRSNIHLWLVAHPTKMYRNKNGEYPVPTLYDISGSAHFRNKCDNGIVLWRDLNEPGKRAVEIHVQKIRFREVGKIGGCELMYDPATGAYDDQFKTMAVAQSMKRQLDGTEKESPAPAWWDQA